MSVNPTNLHPDDIVVAHGLWHGTQDPRRGSRPQDFLWTFEVLPGLDFGPLLVSDSVPGPVARDVVTNR